eukprot:374284-Prymnesium_polylepis.1
MEEAAEHIAKLAANTTTLTAQLEELTIKHEKTVEELAKAHGTLSDKVGDGDDDERRAAGERGAGRRRRRRAAQAASGGGGGGG